MDKDKMWIACMEWFAKYWGCHQMPERSFFYRNYQLPVCARCTGIIIGEMCSTLSVMFGVHISSIVVSAMLVIPMVADGSIQYLSRYTSSNIKRLISGILFGYGIIQLIVNIALLVIH